MKPPMDTIPSQEAGLPPQYAAVEALAARMLAAARLGDWDAVADLRRQLPLLRAELETAWRNSPLAGPGQETLRERCRLGAIGRILDIDAQIRQLAQPWRTGLDDLLNRRRQSQ